MYIQISMSTKSVYHSFIGSIKILLIHNQILGLLTFSCTKTNFVPSKTRIVYNVLLICVYALLTSYAIQTMLHFEMPAIYAVTGSLNLIASWIYLTISWICDLLKREKLITFLTRIIIFDSKFPKKSINYDRSRKRILFQLTVRYIGLMMYILSSIYSVVNYPKYDFSLGHIVSCLGITVNLGICCEIIEIVSIIKTRFVVLNRQIMKQIDLSSRFKRNFIEVRKSKTLFNVLSQICSHHHYLSKLVQLFNKIFGPVLLAMFGSTFVVIAVSCFIISAQLQVTSDPVWSLQIGLVIIISGFIFDIVYVCGTCYLTVREARKSGKLIHKIETEEREVIDEIEMFSLQIDNEKLKFSAAGFFDINYSLVLSIFGGITTYIIILIQLGAATVKQEDLPI